jgi:hypothetical protein
MTRFAPLWQQANSYPATLDRSLISTIYPNGGIVSGQASAVANTMNVSIAPGTLVVPLQSGQGAALCRWDAGEVVTLPASPPSGQSRIDLVIAQVRDNALDAGANNDFIFTSVTGTAVVSGPVAPALPTNAFAVATVLVPGAVANLNTATLTRVAPQLHLDDAYHARVYRQSAFTIGAAGAAINFDGVERDPLGLWVPAAQGFVVPVGGIWLVVAHLTATPVSGGTISVSIRRQAITGQISGAHASSANTVTAVAVEPVFCNAGDTIQIFGATVSGTYSGVIGLSGTTATIDYWGTG